MWIVCNFYHIRAVPWTTSAAKAARLAFWGLPAPSSLPTRTLAAVPRPRGIWQKEKWLSLSLLLSFSLSLILLQNWSFQTASTLCSQPAATHQQNQQLSYWFQKSTTQSRPWVVQGYQAWRRGPTLWDCPSSTPSKSFCVDLSPTRNQWWYKERQCRTPLGI